jgi:hypothetical protein
MLPNGYLKLYKFDPTRNGLEIIKVISEFIEYRKELFKEDITKYVHDTHELLIVYWDRIRSALTTLGVDTRMILIQEFWPQS